MEGQNTSSTIHLPKLKLNTNIGKRPDSMKLELISIPENEKVISFNSLANKSTSVSSVGFRNISCRVKVGFFKRKSRTLLDKVHGDFLAGELTAIMGPSGSGKTTLMNILAGYTTTNVTGEKLVNNECRSETVFRKKSCYIMQDDNLHPLLTVQEAMKLAADLKLSSTFALKEKKARIKEILDSLNLQGHLKTCTCNLSGGQKKRLTIALELLNNPEVMFFDEPTSGLDSLQTKQCVMLLKELAMSGRVIVCTIHQPSASILEMFDHLYVVGDGKCVYQGAVKGLLPYLHEENLICPQYHNPADFVLEVVTGIHGQFTDQLSRKAQNGLNSDWRKSQSSSPLHSSSFDRIENMMSSGQITPVHAPPILSAKMINCDKPESPFLNCCKGSYSTSYFNQVCVLVKRAFMIIRRDRTLTYSRLLTHTVIALVIGILYYGIGTDASNMMNNFNYMFFSMMFLMLTPFNCIITTFPLEMPIITREHFNQWYSLKSYYIAISLADTPIQIIATMIYTLLTYFLTHQPYELYRICLFSIISVLASLVAHSFGILIGALMDFKNGVIFGPFFLTPFVVFAGFFIKLNAAPTFLRWIFHLSYLKYGIEGLVLSVLGYDRGKMPCNADYCQFVYPSKFLTDMSMQNSQYSTSVIFLGSLVIFLRFVGYFALSLKIRWSRERR